MGALDQHTYFSSSALPLCAWSDVSLRHWEGKTERGLHTGFQACCDSFAVLNFQTQQGQDFNSAGGEGAGVSSRPTHGRTSLLSLLGTSTARGGVPQTRHQDQKSGFQPLRLITPATSPLTEIMPPAQKRSYDVCAHLFVSHTPAWEADTTLRQAGEEPAQQGFHKHYITP